MAINHVSILEKLKDYSSIMYRDISSPDELRLRTGDVIELGFPDFEKILRNVELLKPLLESYFSNPKYHSHFWSILNKPCDMVHSATQKFKANLFLCPLQSFRRELKKEHLFDEYVSSPLGVVKPAEKLIQLFQKFVEVRAKELIPIANDEPAQQKKEKGNLRKKFGSEQVDWARHEVFSFFDDFEKLELYDESLISYRTELQKNNQTNEYSIFISFIDSLASNEEWTRYKAEYQAQIDGIDEVRINSKKAKDLVQTVFINQMENKGMFFYEPHYNLYSKELCDFSYVIELEDIITFKLDSEMIKSGGLVQLLQEKRRVGLTRNFSDRLQNIMGYYFSKIGTQDVKGADVLGIYDDCFDNFHYEKAQIND